jgi:diguanylate cyclase (GGDEF)-like protein/putative nucleotidyltransferase with HDIG domain
MLITGIYPCLIGAILLLPKYGISPVARLRILLDSLIIIVTVATFCFYFLLAPLLMLSDESPAEKIAGTLFPSADLIVIFCLLLVALRSDEPQLRPALIMLGLALSAIFLLHVGRLIDILNDTLHWVTRLACVWIPASACITGAAQTIKRLLQREREMENTSPAAAEKDRLTGRSFLASRWKSFLALILVLLVSLFIFLLWAMRLNSVFQGQIIIIYAGGFLILMLVVLRQLLAMYEIGVLQGKLQRRNRSLSLLNDILEKQVITDPLTGLPNHRELLLQLNRALEHARSAASTCTIIFMDIDYFKAVNDNYGHLVGDAVLCEFSELVAAEMRAEDYLGRWGGEEFVAVFPSMEPAEAFQMAERIRVVVEQHSFADEERVRLTCSLGIATYPYEASCCHDLLMNADRAMYTAKRLGRNQLRGASEPLVLAMGMLGEESEVGQEAEMLAVVESFLTALEARDRLTGEHSRRVATLSLKLALALGLPWADACIIGMGGLLHDLGKVAMPDAILFKHGKLSAAEVEYIARHPLIGEEILAPLPSLRAVAKIVRTHHEWVNGSGYPDGLRGDDIPLGARIVAVADAYDAIISHRVYREGRAPSEATKELSKGSGRQFDPRVVEALNDLLATGPRLSITTAPG